MATNKFINQDFRWTNFSELIDPVTIAQPSPPCPWHTLTEQGCVHAHPTKELKEEYVAVFQGAERD